MAAIRKEILPWKNDTQSRNLYWVLPRPKPDRYKGGMPLYAEKWLILLAEDILKNKNPKILNLFCGMNTYGLRVDLNPDVKPDICCDCHKLSEYLDGKFDIILADPPYSNEECLQLYGSNYPKLQYKLWTSQADKFLKRGGLLIIYDKNRKPNPSPDNYKIIRRVAIESRVNHQLRCVIFFQKLG